MLSSSHLLILTPPDCWYGKWEQKKGLNWEEGHTIHSPCHLQPRPYICWHLALPQDQHYDWRESIWLTARAWDSIGGENRTALFWWACGCNAQMEEKIWGVHWNWEGLCWKIREFQVDAVKIKWEIALLYYTDSPSYNAKKIVRQFWALRKPHNQFCYLFSDPINSTIWKTGIWVIIFFLI